MENEVRYYFSSNKITDLLNKIIIFNDLSQGYRTYEKTIQYDHPSEQMSFYNKEIDGRFRFRISINEIQSKCKLSWKRRIKNNLNTDDINTEEEVELNIKVEEKDNFEFIVEEVLKMKKIESYERYRTTFSNEEVEIALDEYPFGLALEIESKVSNEKSREVIEKWLEKLELKLENSYKLSWDDKYTELCLQQGIENFKHVAFGLPMPEVK